jgi:uncharacterized protein YecE (DUF72 family)
VAGSQRYGIRGWQRLEGIYPARTHASEMLGLYAKHGAVVEAQNFFNGIPKPGRITEWVSQSPEGFKFDVVAFGGLTLYQRRPGAPDHGVKSWREVAVEPPGVLFEDFCESVQPLCEAHKLGAVILQFPPWFEAGPEAHEYLARVREQLSGFPLAVEFRHPTWEVPVNRESTMDVLIELELGVVIADFPMGIDDWSPPFDFATVDRLAIVRLHGQNAESWKRTLTSPVSPLVYEYEGSQLEPWVERIRSIRREVEEVHVLVGTATPDIALQTAKALGEAVNAADERDSRWGHAG